ncbi:hypothetical protein ABIA13_005759 [Sinorhizobium fredii]
MKRSRHYEIACTSLTLCVHVTAKRAKNSFGAFWERMLHTPKFHRRRTLVTKEDPTEEKPNRLIKSGAHSGEEIEIAASGLSFRRP